MALFRKFLYVFSGNRRQLFFLVLIFLLTSILEAFGIGLLGPFLNLAGEPSKVVQDNYFFAWAYRSLKFSNPSDLVVWFGLFIIIVFIIKSIIYFLSKRYSYKILFYQF